MATKWKNNRLFILFIFLFTFGVSGIFHMMDFIDRYKEKSYYESGNFESELYAFTSELATQKLYLLPIEEVKKKLTVEGEEINRFLRIELSENSGSSVTMDASNKEEVIKVIKREKEKALEEYYKQIPSWEYALKEKTFKYYLRNDVTGKITTNTNLSSSFGLANPFQEETNKIIKKVIIHPGEASYFTFYPYYEDESTTFHSSLEINYDDLVDVYQIGTYEGYIAVPKAINDSYLMKEEQWYRQNQILLIIYSLLGVSALGTASILYVKKKLYQYRLASFHPIYDRLLIDFKIILWGITCGIFISCQFLLVDRFRYSDINVGDYFLPVILLLVTTTVVSCFLFIQTHRLIDNLKEEKKDILNHVFMILLYRKIKRASSKAFSKWSLFAKLTGFTILLFVFGVLSVFIWFIPMMLIFYIPLLIFIISAIYIGGKNVKKLEKIVNYTEEIASGSSVRDMEAHGEKSIVQLITNINKIKQGVAVWQHAQEKSERLKTELITNVSHDLRTPLTSIITYAELLKQTNVTEEERATYLAVIERKSLRLKGLIDDLFEVSKMVSGNIELKKEVVDLVQLLQQALGEYDENIADSLIEFRVTKDSAPILSNVDGQKMWRVFDNLIGNILKYSLEHTRAYISIKKEQAQAVIVFKNISKYEFDENIEELFERFKRGDTSRHTEGSGLGLAIAKSIIDLHKGIMIIETDGDLFKVTIKLSLYEETSY